MPAMTDPFEGLLSFQDAYLNGLIDLTLAGDDPTFFVHDDKPDGVTPRLTYARIVNDEVFGIAMFVRSDPVEGIPCFQLGYASAEGRRNNGVATGIVKASIIALKKGLARHGLKEFYVEAVIGSDNVPSQRVAAKALGAEPTEVTDEHSGMPALLYLSKL